MFRGQRRKVRAGIWGLSTEHSPHLLSHSAVSDGALTILTAGLGRGEEVPDKGFWRMEKWIENLFNTSHSLAGAAYPPQCVLMNSATRNHFLKDKAMAWLLQCPSRLSETSALFRCYLC